MPPTSFELRTTRLGITSLFEALCQAQMHDLALPKKAPETILSIMLTCTEAEPDEAATNEREQRAGRLGHVYIGHEAMPLAFKLRPATKDIELVYYPPREPDPHAIHRYFSQPVQSKQWVVVSRGLAIGVYPGIQAATPALNVKGSSAEYFVEFDAALLHFRELVDSEKARVLNADGTEWGVVTVLLTKDME
ncbi:hypothetical protein C8J56DRAFT_890958 [Mycena floridula]|nr:hypothetical protein C8J56DRAFT_890958 [Mycena floridula]